MSVVEVVTSLTEKDSMYPQEFLAKKLNNRASFLLSIGNYEKGISLLTTALNLSERSSNLSQNKQPCSCTTCSLETSLSTDPDDSFVTMMMSDHEKEGNHNNIEKKKNECIDEKELTEHDDNNDDNEDETIHSPHFIINHMIPQLNSITIHSHPNVVLYYEKRMGLCTVGHFS